jgi:cyclophilin family peptidyl-prolyl cis-trans isomerase
VLAQIEELHPNDFQLVFRHFPLLSIHDKASLAGQAAESAGEQGAFWEMHDYLFERFSEWTPMATSEFVLWLKDAAAEIGLDVVQFNSDIDTGRFAPMMEQAFTAALQSGLTGTPAMILNGEVFRLSPELPIMEASVRLLLLGNRQFTEYPPMTVSTGDDYIARLRLNTGEMVIQLYADAAPQAVNSFIFLAQSGWYDGNILHLVIPETLVETGDPSGTGFGDPGYHFETEFSSGLNYDAPGMVGITSNGPNTNGSKFFITMVPLPDLDGVHTLFGRVISGLDLLEGLIARDALDDILLSPETIIESITIEEQ